MSEVRLDKWLWAARFSKHEGLLVMPLMAARSTLMMLKQNHPR